jgi:hypothetical protein
MLLYSLTSGGPSSISAGMNYAAPAGVTLEVGSEQPLHRRIASYSNHLCTSSDNDLRSMRLASNSDHLRVRATARRSSPRPPTGGNNEAIKAKKSRTQRQMALMPSSAEATTSARVSLTSDSDHLCTSRRRLPQHA